MISESRTAGAEARPDPGPAGDLSCPDCLGPLGRPVVEWACPGCGRPVGTIGGRIVDFLGDPGPSAGRMLRWPAGLVNRLLPLLEHSGPADIDPDGPPVDLEALGLAGPDRALTALGRKVRYQLSEQQWQAGDDQFQACLDLGSLGAGSMVLDIGCGAGQTLQVLEDRSPSGRIGVDYDAEVLALGRLAADNRGQAIEFCRATAHALPFADGQFSHVLCRVALNYMHQGLALAEMVRVMAPGGCLYLRVERAWYDLRLLTRSGGPREASCRLRDLGYGVALAVTGWQPMPGRRVSGGRAFATLGGLSARLEKFGLAVIKAEESDRCPRFLGRSTQAVLMARRPGPGR